MCYLRVLFFSYHNTIKESLQKLLRCKVSEIPE